MGRASVDEYAEGVRAGEASWIARAITLVESTRPDDRQLAQELLIRLTPAAGGARRIGVTGVPGVGKSTFIDALGSHLTATGHRVAVLAVDPSSTRTGGSILGDKTRMTRLASDPDAFVRPSPTAGTLGGVATATREAIVVVEAAGFDVVLVETVGVGQSEIAVAELVDSFLLLTLARAAGADLQRARRHRAGRGVAAAGAPPRRARGLRRAGAQAQPAAGRLGLGDRARRGARRAARPPRGGRAHARGRAGGAGRHPHP